MKYLIILLIPFSMAFSEPLSPEFEVVECKAAVELGSLLQEQGLEVDVTIGRIHKHKSREVDYFYFLEIRGSEEFFQDSEESIQEISMAARIVGEFSMGVPWEARMVCFEYEINSVFSRLDVCREMYADERGFLKGEFTVYD